MKLTLPGMPDIYQGAELWDLSLVDPDNRRPVDYGLRARLLEQASAALESDRGAGMLHMLEKWQDGSVKLAVTAALLAHRRQQPELYAHGSYQPLAATGAKADQLCAFMRSHGAECGDHRRQPLPGTSGGRSSLGRHDNCLATKSI